MEKSDSGLGYGNVISWQDTEDGQADKDSSEEFISEPDYDSTDSASESSISDVESTSENRSLHENSSFFNLWETLREDIVGLRREGLLEEGGALFDSCKRIEYIRNHELWRRLAAERFSYSALFNFEGERYLSQNSLNAIEYDGEEGELRVDDDGQSFEGEGYPSNYSYSIITYFGEEEELRVDDYESYLERDRTNVTATEGDLDNHHGDRPQQKISSLHTLPNLEIDSKLKGESLEVDEALKEREPPKRSTFADGDRNAATITTLGQESSIKYDTENRESFVNEISSIPESATDDRYGLTGAKEEGEEYSTQVSEGKNVMGMFPSLVCADQVGKIDKEQEKYSNLEDAHLGENIVQGDSIETNEILIAARKEFLKETWYYDEIKEDPKECTIRTMPDEKEVMTSYPLTEQSKMERRYKIRKEKAWQEWLHERDREKRQRALLEIQSVMNAQKMMTKIAWKSPTAQDIAEKEEKEREQARLKREREIEETLAKEDQWWKKKLAESGKNRYEEEPRIRFTKQHIQNVKCFFQKLPKKKDTKQEPVTPSSRDLLTVSQLPAIDLTSESEIPTNSPEGEARNEKPTDRAKRAQNKTHIENRITGNQENIKNVTKKCDMSYRHSTNEKLCEKEIVYGKFQVTPDVLIFKDFIPKNTYHQKLTIHNLEGKPKQLCVVGIWYSHESLKGQGILEFEKNTETTPKIVRINPGLKYDIWLVFKPRTIADSMAVSAQVVFWTGQGQLSTTRIKWAEDLRAHNPGEIKDSGFMLVTVLCRQALVDPKLISQYIMLDIIPQRDGTVRVPHRNIVIENKGSKTGYFEIIKKPKQLSGDSRSRKVLQLAASDKKRSKSEHSSRLSLNVNRLFSNVLPLNKKSISLSTINTTQNFTKNYSTIKIAQEVTEDVFEMATSCFELKPQYLGVLPAQSSQTIHVKLKKSALQSNKRRFFEEYVLKFGRDSKTPEISVWIGFRSQSPIERITVNKKKIDFGICRAGGRYQDFLEVSNKSGAVKGLILMEMDEDMKENITKSQLSKTRKTPNNYTLEVHPSGLAFIQPQSKFSFALRLHVRKAELTSERFNNLTSNNNNKNAKEQVDIKLELLEVTQARDPTYSGTHTTKKQIHEITAEAVFSDLAADADLLPLKLDPTHLNLGRCVTTETICANISLISQTKVILEYGFLGLPKYVTLQPGYGFGKILPQETLTLKMLYSPLPEHGSTYPGKEFIFQLACHNTFDEANPNTAEPAKMTVSATVIHIPNLRLSCSTLSFPVTPCGSYSMASFTISSNEGLNSPNEKSPKLQSPLSPSINSRTSDHKAGKGKLIESGYWYEFISQSEEVTIAPRHGYLQPQQVMTIKACFQPKLEKVKILAKAEELWKSDEKLIMEKQLEIERSKQEKASTKGKAKDKKGTKKETGKKKRNKEEKFDSKQKRKPKEEPMNPKTLNSENDDKNESNLNPQEQGPSDTSLLHMQEKHSTKEESKEKIKTLLFPAEKNILESLEPYLFQTKIACVVTKGYPSDCGTGISNFSKALFQRAMARESEWCDFVDSSGYSISRGCAWAIPPEEKIPDVIWMDIICPVSQPSFLTRECGGEWLSERETLQENSEINLNETVDYQGIPIWSNMTTTHKQVVDFQRVAVGGGMKTLTVKLQNIHPTPIKIHVPSLTNPFGPFTSPLSHLLGFSEVISTENTKQDKDLKSEKLLTKYVSVPAEGLMRIPVTFTPIGTDEVIEFMDLKGCSSEGIMTYATIVLKGKGELPDYVFHPSPPIITLKPSKNQKPAILMIQNRGNAVLNFHVGEIKEVYEPEKMSKKQKGKGKKGSPEDSKKPKRKGKVATHTPPQEEEKTPKKEKDAKKLGHKGKKGGKETKNAKLDEVETKVAENSQVGIKGEETALVQDHQGPQDIAPFVMEPQGVVQVMPNEKKEWKFYHLHDKKDAHKTFSFPLYLFGRGKEVANVTVKVVTK